MLPAGVIRRGTEADLPALLDLLTLYFHEGSVLSTETALSLQRQMQTPLLGWFVADGPVGLAGCVLCHPLKHVDSAAECKRLYVLSTARGNGLGARLMDAAEDAARSAGLCWMYLDSKNSFAVAMAMYKRRGYVACRRFNENPEATFFFRKRLG